jgi:hypothetical protein
MDIMYAPPGESWFFRFKQPVTGTVYDLGRYASVREQRLKVGTKAHVWLGDEIAGDIGRERLRRKGRLCWRWVGYDVTGEPLPDTVSDDKMTTARAVAMEFLSKRRAGR